MTKAVQRAYYTEKGWKAEVEILEDLSDEDHLKYTLKVIKTVVVGLLGSIPDGEEFKACISKKHECYQDWLLEPIA